MIMKKKINTRKYHNKWVKAIENGNINILDCLLKMGMPIDYCNNDAIKYSIYKRRDNVVEFLLSRGAKI